jgi:hypothetical protein
MLQECLSYVDQADVKSAGSAKFASRLDTNLLNHHDYTNVKSRVPRGFPNGQEVIMNSCVIIGP